MPCFSTEDLESARADIAQCKLIVLQLEVKLEAVYAADSVTKRGTQTSYATAQEFEELKSAQAES